MQSRKYSAMESLTNVLAGYALAVCGQIALFPAFGIHVSVRTNLAIGIWFTATSLVRSYAVRRIFSRWEAD